MTKPELLDTLKAIATEVMVSETGADPAATRADLDARLSLEAPLTELGWDSVRLTWLLVRVEERFDIDTSGISMYDLFVVEDLIDELLARMG